MTVWVPGHTAAVWLSCPPQLLQSCHLGITFHHPPRDSLLISRVGFPVSLVFHFLGYLFRFEGAHPSVPSKGCWTDKTLDNLLVWKYLSYLLRTCLGIEILKALLYCFPASNAGLGKSTAILLPILCDLFCNCFPRPPLTLCESL